MVNNNSNQDILESQGGTPTPEKKAQDRASAVGADTGSVGSPQKKEDAVFMIFGAMLTLKNFRNTLGQAQHCLKWVFPGK